MGRLDQGISEIAKLPFVVGQLELRRAQADAGHRLAADPAVHVVAQNILAGAAEVAAAAAPEGHAGHKQHQAWRRDQNLQFFPDRKTRLRHIWGVRCQVRRRRRRPGAAPSSGPLPPLVSSVLRSIRTTGRISTIPMPSRGAPSMVEAGRREAASAGKTMMVPMLNSLWLPL